MLGILKVLVSYLLFPLTKEMPEYDVTTDGSKCNQNIKKMAFYVGCEDNRSDRYRVYNIVNALRSKNITVDIYKSHSIKYLTKKVNYDLIVIFREDRYRFLRWKKVGNNLKKNGIPIIYDVDDYTIFNPSSRTTKNVLNIVGYADAITVTTKYLANLFEKATGKKTYIIKNTLNDEQMFLSKKIVKNQEEEKVKIAYQSGTATHNRDFEVAENALIKALAKYSNVELHIFGPLELSNKFVLYKDRIIYHPYMNYLFLQIYISDMDINIAPLELNDFNHSKSELKIFEAALVRIPTICSPTASYTAIIKNRVNGYVASTEEEWERDLQELIEDKGIRNRIGNKAYEDFTEMFYMRNEIDEIISIYEEIIFNKKGGK